jgi:uncharacterized membrane protein YsdA (DUF1294 family)
MIGFGGAFTLMVLLWLGDFVTNWVTAWLIAINVITLLMFGYDKAIAERRWQRVPEWVLLALTSCFGTLGTVIGMLLFHHKTAKGSFQRKFWLIVTVQVILLAAYFVVGQ